MTDTKFLTSYLNFDYNACLSLQSMGNLSCPHTVILAQSKQKLNKDGYLQLFTQAMQCEPKTVFDFYFMGIARLALYSIDKQSAHKSKAEEYFATVCDLSVKKDEFVCYIKGSASYYLKRYSQGVELLSSAINLSPTLSAAYYTRGFCFYSMRNYQRAATDFEECKKQGVNEPIMLKSLAKSYFKLEEYALSAANYDKFLRNQEDLESISGCAKAYFLCGNLPSAEHYLSKALLLTPDDPDLRFMRAETYAMQNNYAKAIADYTKILLEYPTEKAAYLKRGNTYLLCDKFTEALDDFNKVLEINPQESGVYFNLGLAKFSMGQYEQALIDFSKVIKLDKTDVGAHKMRAKTYEKLGERNNAILDLEAALKFEDSTQILIDLGHLYYSQNPKVALEYYLRAIKKETRDLDVFLKAAQIYFDQNDLFSCAVVCEQAIELGIASHELIRLCAKAYSAQGNRDKAKHYYAMLAQQNPQDADATYWLSHILKCEGNYDAIVSTLKNVPQKDENLLMFFSEAAFRCENFDDAEKALLNVLKINDKNAVAHNNLGKVYESKGKFSNAKECFDKAVVCDKNYSTAYNNRAAVSFLKGDYLSALNDYNKAIEINPNNATYFFNRAAAYEFMGGKKNTALAISDYQATLRLSPNHRDALSALKKLT